MSTIIAHGKSKWDRSVKNIRIDPEMEAEMEYQAQQSNVKSIEAEILVDISNKIEMGTSVVTKIDASNQNTPIIVVQPIVGEPSGETSVLPTKKKLNKRSTK